MFPRHIGVTPNFKWSDFGIDGALRGLRLPVSAKNELIIFPTINFSTVNQEKVYVNNAIGDYFTSNAIQTQLYVVFNNNKKCTVTGLSIQLPWNAQVTPQFWGVVPELFVPQLSTPNAAPQGTLIFGVLTQAAFTAPAPLLYYAQNVNVVLNANDCLVVALQNNVNVVAPFAFACSFL